MVATQTPRSEAVLDAIARVWTGVLTPRAGDDGAA
jgi:hypothetical protein